MGSYMRHRDTVYKTCKMYDKNRACLSLSYWDGGILDDYDYTYSELYKIDFGLQTFWNGVKTDVWDFNVYWYHDERNKCMRCWKYDIQALDKLVIIQEFIYKRLQKKRWTTYVYLCNILPDMAVHTIIDCIE